MNIIKISRNNLIFPLHGFSFSFFSLARALYIKSLTEQLVLGWGGNSRVCINLCSSTLRLCPMRGHLNSSLGTFPSPHCWPVLLCICWLMPFAPEMVDLGLVLALRPLFSMAYAVSEAWACLFVYVLGWMKMEWSARWWDFLVEDPSQNFVMLSRGQLEKIIKIKKES